jgi:hypothetical protein
MGTPRKLMAHPLGTVTFGGAWMSWKANFVTSW